MERDDYSSHNSTSPHSLSISFQEFVRIRFFLRCLIVLGLGFSQLSCEEGRDPQSPDGALRLFGVALAQNDMNLIKSSLSTQTHESLKEILVLSRKIKAGIKRFPNTEAQSWAKQEALGDLSGILNTTVSKGDLFHHLIKDHLQWAKAQPEGEVEQGLNQRRIYKGSVKEGKVILLTRADHQVEMRLEERPEGTRWVVTSFEAPLNQYVKALKTSLGLLEANRIEWVRRQKLHLNLPASHTR